MPPTWSSTVNSLIVGNQWIDGTFCGEISYPKSVKVPLSRQCQLHKHLHEWQRCYSNEFIGYSRTILVNEPRNKMSLHQSSHYGTCEGNQFYISGPCYGLLHLCRTQQIIADNGTFDTWGLSFVIKWCVLMVQKSNVVVEVLSAACFNVSLHGDTLQIIWLPTFVMKIRFKLKTLA